MQSIFGQTNISGGNVSGTWTKAKSPYNIKGNVNISKDSTLTIEPGVQIRFDGKYILSVYGKIKALGKAGDSIRFYPQDTLIRWKGIRFFGKNQAKDSAIFSYCKFEYTGPKVSNIETALYLTRGHFNINNCLFKNNTSVINCNSIYADSVLSLKIDKCYFLKNTNINTDPSISQPVYGVIFMTSGSVSNCKFEMNGSRNSYNSLDDHSVKGDGSGGLIFLYDRYNPNAVFNITNCEFVRNNCALMGAGLHMSNVTNNSKVYIRNCTFADNMTGRYGCISFIGNNFYAKGNMRFVIEGCSFKSNRAANTSYGASEGSAIAIMGFSSNDSLVIRNNFFEGNIGGSTVGLGGRVGGDRNFYLLGNLFKNNMYNCLMATSTIDVYSVNNIFHNNLHALLIGFNSSSCLYHSINDIYAFNGVKTDTNKLDQLLMRTPSGLYYLAGAPVENNFSDGGIFRNCIFWENYNAKGKLLHITTDAGKIVEVSNCIMNGNYDSTIAWYEGSVNTKPSSIILTKQNIISSDPLFVNPPSDYGPDVNTSGADLHLLNTCSKTSPAYNAGFNGALSTWGIKDFDGKPRIKCNVVDIGPYELEAKRKFAEITAEPLDTAGCIGTAYVLKARADCGMNLQYSWQKKNSSNVWNNISGADKLSYSSTLPDLGLYRLIIKQPDCLVEDTSRIVKVSQYPTPKPFLGKDTSIKNNQTLTLTAGNGLSYLWQNNSTNKTFVIDGSATGLGKKSYNVTVTNQSGCKGSDTIEVTVIKDNALDALTTLGWKVSPNPSAGIVNIQCPDNGTFNWDIIDAFGRILDQGNAISDTRIDIDNLPNGPYFLHIFYNSTSAYLKIIKE